MPWYMCSNITSKVMNKIANRYQDASLQDLGKALDSATQLLWHKQEQYLQHKPTPDELEKMQRSINRGPTSEAICRFPACNVCFHFYFPSLRLPRLYPAQGITQHPLF